MIKMKKSMQSHTMELPRRIVVGEKNIGDIGKFLKSLKNTKEVSIISGNHVKKIVQKKINRSLSASKIKNTWYLANNNQLKQSIKLKKRYAKVKMI